MAVNIPIIRPTIDNEFSENKLMFLLRTYRWQYRENYLERTS